MFGASAFQLSSSILIIHFRFGVRVQSCEIDQINQIDKRSEICNERRHRLRHFERYVKKNYKKNDLCEVSRLGKWKQPLEVRLAHWDAFERYASIIAYSFHGTKSLPQCNLPAPCSGFRIIVRTLLGFFSKQNRICNSISHRGIWFHANLFNIQIIGRTPLVVNGKRLNDSMFTKRNFAFRHAFNVDHAMIGRELLWFLICFFLSPLIMPFRSFFMNNSLHSFVLADIDIIRYQFKLAFD